MKKFSQPKMAATAIFSKKKNSLFLFFVFFVLVHYGIDVYALVSC